MLVAVTTLFPPPILFPVPTARNLNPVTPFAPVAVITVGVKCCKSKRKEKRSSRQKAEHLQFSAFLFFAVTLSVTLDQIFRGFSRTLFFTLGFLAVRFSLPFDVRCRFHHPPAESLFSGGEKRFI
jgi:hypothetical protein